MIKSDETKLNVLLHKCLRRILKIYWPKKVTNEDIRFKTNMEEITQQIQHRRWKLIGHVLRKSINEHMRTPEGRRTVQVRDKRPTYTQNACTIFAQTCVKNACDIRVCAHLMRVFPFVVHSHNCALCGILLHNKRQNKRQFLQTPLKGYFR